MAQPLRKSKSAEDYYWHFDQLDGEHPWMSIIPDGHVAYRVRELNSGEIAYFNFPLAKEMGLIPTDHPHQMNPELKKKIISTFAIQIINEYDELYNKKIDPRTIKPKKYMASRYLQLQHPDKKGKTSGDGRGIWNGIIQYKGKCWDVSSRGTGVTSLAPGSVEAKRPLKTGDAEFGYGCGLAEIDELYSASILAEIMHLQGIPTERVLCIIDLGRGTGIGVRAAPNLIRPAHLFMYLKQNRYNDLKKGVDYFIERQIQNNKWKPHHKKSNRYDELALQICDSFAEFTAKLDIDYIFAWLDWDGDNVLADAGIIDYGSVRQFGIRHDKYRYDDVERFSTNLNEQRLKARLIVQVFVQIADYLKTGKKKQLKEYVKHPIVLKFNEQFAEQRAHRLLYRMGFNQNQRNNILNERGLFEIFDREYNYFERAKISGEPQKVPDGVNHPALFNMSHILNKFPKYLLEKDFKNTLMSESVFFKTILSHFAKKYDAQMRAKHKGHIQNFQRLYKLLVLAAAKRKKPVEILSGISERAALLNRKDRITGNGLIQIVFEIMSQVKKGLPYPEVQKIIDYLICSHLGLPEVVDYKSFERLPFAISQPDILERIKFLINEYSEDI